MPSRTRASARRTGGSRASRGRTSTSRLAEEHCRRALDLDATLAEVWITLGMVHAGSGKAAQAVEDLQRALDRDPRNADAYRELAAAYRRLNREADARGDVSEGARPPARLVDHTSAFGATS